MKDVENKILNECFDALIAEDVPVKNNGKIDTLFEGTYGEFGEGPESITYTDTIALVWFCEIFGENHGSDEHISDYVGDQASWIRDIPKLFDENGLDVMTYADRRPAAKFAQALNEKWAGKCSIEDLERQFPDSIQRLARQVSSDGPKISSDPKVRAYLDSVGCDDDFIEELGVPFLKEMFPSVSKGVHALKAQIQDATDYELSLPQFIGTIPR